VVANVGDSRVFRLASGGLERLTVDHTYIQDMITRTGVKPDPALLRQFGHVLTRSLQGNSDKPDIYPAKERWFTLEEGDGFLLCSDGLILDKVADHEPALEQILRESQSLAHGAEAMVSSVLAAGSSDNISVVLARWSSAEENALPPVEPAIPDTAVEPKEEEVVAAHTPPGFRRLMVVALLLFLCAAAAVVFGVHSCAGPGDAGVPSAQARSIK
jgi:protein phosphatase